jgi:hypothetical protein
MNSLVVELSLLLVRFSKFLKIGVSPVLAPKLGQFARDYLDVVFDVTTDDSRMDIVAGGFDAGIHFGEYIEKDMITPSMYQFPGRRRELIPMGIREGQEILICRGERSTDRPGIR